MSDIIPPAAHAPAERWLQWATTSGITILVGMLAWIGGQLVEMRDAIATSNADDQALGLYLYGNRGFPPITQPSGPSYQLMPGMPVLPILTAASVTG